MSVISQFAGGGVKSVQSGVATVAGNITVTQVNLTKTVVYSVSKGSAGTVAATGTVSAAVGSYSGIVELRSGGYAVGPSEGLNATGVESGTLYTPAAAITGGTTNLTTKQFSARLTGDTTLAVDGPCEWQIVEYY